jgi:hypothetical protein
VFGVQKKLARASLALNGIIKTRQLHLSKSVKEFEGLDIEGLGTGLNGVSVTSGKEVYIIRCAIRHFTGNGVNLAGSTNAGHAFINDSSIAFNAGGVNVQGTANIASITNSSISPIRVSRCGRMAPATSSACRLAYSTTARRGSACGPAGRLSRSDRATS